MVGPDWWAARAGFPGHVSRTLQARLAFSFILGSEESSKLFISQVVQRLWWCRDPISTCSNQCVKIRNGVELELISFSLITGLWDSLFLLASLIVFLLVAAIIFANNREEFF